ncbi:MAG: hypothetical protein WD628_04565 [Thermomicrobiales bacterium]
MAVSGIDLRADWLDIAQPGATSQTSRVATTADGIAAFVRRLGALALPRIGLEATGAADPADPADPTGAARAARRVTAKTVST